MDKSADHAQLAILALRSSDLFREVPEPDLARLASYFEWLSVSKGQEIIKEGAVSDFSVLVVQGAFEVVKSRSGGQRLMGIAKDGALLGELGLVTDEPRYATCRAVETSAICLLTRERFDQMRGRDPDIHGLMLSGLMRQMARRLRQVTEAIFSLKEKNDIAIDSARRILETSMSP